MQRNPAPGWSNRIEIFIAARRENAEQTASVGQDEQPCPVAERERLGMTAGAPKHFLQIAQIFHSKGTV